MLPTALFLYLTAYLLLLILSDPSTFEMLLLANSIALVLGNSGYNFSKCDMFRPTLLENGRGLRVLGVVACRVSCWLPNLRETERGWADDGSVTLGEEKRRFELDYLL